MKKIIFEIFAIALFVIGGTIFLYTRLSGVPLFWSEQTIWSGVLMFCWFVVMAGYVHQGVVIRRAQSSTHVSLILPLAVFVVQCVLFVKGIYYHDWSLIAGAVVVNCGVVFVIYQILSNRK